MNAPHQTIIAVSLGFALAIWHSVPTLALEPPGEGEIKSALDAELPPYWSIDSVGISASVNDGDEVSPRYRQRFVANAMPNEELYLSLVDNPAIGPFTVVVSTRTTTQVHKLYGISISVPSRGNWSTELVMENSVERLGMPRSLFSGSVVVAGSAQADQAAADLLKARELIKTVAEGIARASVNAEAMQRLAAEETEALESANRQRLEALKERYEQERATIAAAADRERRELEESSRQRLEALKAKLMEESAAIETLTAATERERTRLVEEHQRRLDALKSKYERERAAVTASAETLDAVSEAEAETAAHRRLVSALAALTEERNRATEIGEQAIAAEMRQRTARYDALLAALGSDNVSQRHATFDLALASGDEHVRATAISEAMKSGDDGLQAKALAELIVSSPRIGVTILDAKGKATGNQLFEIVSVDSKDLTFSGKYFQPLGHDPDKPNGSGSVQRNRISLAGTWKHRANDGTQHTCTVSAEVDKEGIVSGTITCGDGKHFNAGIGDFTAKAVINL